jgi:hypothetical protein
MYVSPNSPNCTTCSKLKLHYLQYFLNRFISVSRSRRRKRKIPLVLIFLALWVWNIIQISATDLFYSIFLLTLISRLIVLKLPYNSFYQTSSYSALSVARSETTYKYLKLQYINRCCWLFRIKILIVGLITN